MQNLIQKILDIYPRKEELNIPFGQESWKRCIHTLLMQGRLKRLKLHVTEAFQVATVTQGVNRTIVDISLK